MTYIGTDRYERVDSWAVNDADVVVGSVQRTGSSLTTTAFRASGNVLALLSFGPGVVSWVARGINTPIDFRAPSRRLSP
jgi:hypothetical protein